MSIGKKKHKKQQASVCHHKKWFTANSFVTTPTSFQNDLFFYYKQIYIMNKNNQTDGLHRLFLSGLRVYIEVNRILTTK